MYRAQNQTVEVVQTPLHFGLRRWFLCPGVHHNLPCRNRARILYFPPNRNRLGCRKCLNLIHRSAREHDKTIDSLLQLSPEEFRKVLATGSIRQRLLAVQASVVMFDRLQKKAKKLSSTRRQLPALPC
jgi:hypothetical protein